MRECRWCHHRVNTKLRVRAIICLFLQKSVTTITESIILIAHNVICIRDTDTFYWPSLMPWFFIDYSFLCQLYMILYICLCLLFEINIIGFFKQFTEYYFYFTRPWQVNTQLKKKTKSFSYCALYFAMARILHKKREKPTFRR